MMKLRIIPLALLLFAHLSSGAQVVINEFMASNSKGIWDMEGEDYSDWVELYNTSSDTVDVSKFGITDNLNYPSKYRLPSGTIIPPKGYLIVWADKLKRGLHTSFSLSIAKEEIGLFDRKLNRLDSVKYKAQKQNVSFGRIGDGDSDWGYLSEPTPGEANSRYGQDVLKFASIPSLSLAGGYLAKGSVLAISHPKSSATIRYTLDGSNVTSNSQRYSGNLILDSSVVLKARAYEDGVLPSKTVARTYITDAPSSLPVVSVITDPDNLWDDQKGIYVVGTNGTTGGGDKIVANYWQSWERPAVVEMYEVDGSRAFISGAEIKLISPYVRKFPQKPMSIKFSDYVSCQIFPDKEANQFRAMTLRNSGNDMALTFFRDGMMQSLLIDQMDIDYQGYRPAAVFLNGQYWGIHNIREKANADYVFSNHNVDRGRVDLLEDWTAQVLKGSRDEYLELRKFMIENDMTLAENYAYVKNEIDVDEYMNYMIAEIYFNNLDWPGGNMKFWRSQDEGSKWRWILFDVDFGFGLYRGYDSNTLAHAAAAEPMVFGRSVSPLVTVLFRKLLDNPEFKSEFIQRFAGYLNTSFHPERVARVIDSVQAKIEVEMPNHIAKWGGNGGIPSMEVWKDNIDVAREFGKMRPEYQRQDIIKQFDLKGTIDLNLGAVNGHVILNGVELPSGQSSGVYFKGAELRLTAIPDVGYKFRNWEGDLTGSDAGASLIPNRSLELTAVFEPSGESILPDIITEDMTLTKANSPYVAKADVIIGRDAVLYVEPGVEIVMPAKGNIIVKGGFEVRGSTEGKIMIRANYRSGYKSWGAICLDSASKPVVLSYAEIKDATHGKDKSVFVGAVGGHHSDLTIFDCKIDDVFGQPVYAEYGSTAIRYSSLHTKISSDIVNVKYGEAIIEYCNLRGNNQPNTDGIDYDGVTGGVIRRSVIHDFMGYNSDGIDVGEAATDILLESNIIKNCSDKGVSVGQKSSVKLYRNTIINCNQGIGIKDSASFALIDKCVFYKNTTGIAVFEKNINRGGGRAEVINTIISQSKKASVMVDRYSILDVSYTLSDMDLLRGLENIYADPMFESPGTGEFALREGSPCFNAGAPLTILDFGKAREHIGSHEEKRKVKMHLAYYILLGIGGLAGVFVFGK